MDCEHTPPCYNQRCQARISYLVAGVSRDLSARLFPHKAARPSATDAQSSARRARDPDVGHLEPVGPVLGSESVAHTGKSVKLHSGCSPTRVCRSPRVNSDASRSRAARRPRARASARIDSCDARRVLLLSRDGNGPRGLRLR